jgi:hypothetical protein
VVPRVQLNVLRSAPLTHRFALYRPLRPHLLFNLPPHRSVAPLLLGQHHVWLESLLIGDELGVITVLHLHVKTLVHHWVYTATSAPVRIRRRHKHSRLRLQRRIVIEYRLLFLDWLRPIRYLFLRCGCGPIIFEGSNFSVKHDVLFIGVNIVFILLYKSD